MTQTNPTPPTVEVMWRPGCPFCGSLRRGLSRAGVATIEHDIWASADAAARVREATGGDETVPTVFVGPRALVNPSVRQVVDAISAVDPDYRPLSTPATGRGGGTGTNRALSPGLIWTLVVAVVWSVLVVWRPTTTWHLAPLILASAWPWVVGQDSASGDHSARSRIMLAGGAGLSAALALTGVLSASGRLYGPTWTGSGTPVIEALLLSVGGAAIATTVGLRRTMRRTTSASARLGTSLVATSDDIVTVEGNAYFPPAQRPRRSAAIQQHHQRVPLEGSGELLRRPRRRTGRPGWSERSPTGTPHLWLVASRAGSRSGKGSRSTRSGPRSD
jgi:glutaredoxin